MFQIIFFCILNRLDKDLAEKEPKDRKFVFDGMYEKSISIYFTFCPSNMRNTSNAMVIRDINGYFFRTILP